MSEAYLQESIGPVVLGRDPHDREAIFQELWTIDRHEAFFPVFLPGPVDVALWDICAKEAGLPLYKYIGACRDSLPVYASGNFHGTVKEYVDEALYYQSKGIPGYKAHPGGPVSFDMEVHQAIRDAVGPDYLLMTDPVGDYTINEAVTVGRQLERLNYKWFEEPFRDFELYKYTELCRTLDIPIAATETAHLAEAFGLNCEIHTTTMNYMDLVNLHVSCAIKNCEYFEYFVPEENYTLPMKGKLPIDEHGIIHVPHGPGVGAELDWDLIEKSCRSYRKLEYKG